MVFAGAALPAANAVGASAIRDCLLMSKNSQNSFPEAHAPGGQSGTNYLTLAIRTLEGRLVLFAKPKYDDQMQCFAT